MNEHSKTRIFTSKKDLETMWIRAKNACRTTVNKKHTGNEPLSKFKTKLLISEHSPIRLIKINWIWKSIKSFCATHFSRHRWECFISTQRTDRTGVNREDLKQTELVIFEGELNAQNAIDTARKRLCFQSDNETREYMEDFKISLKQEDLSLSDILVPNCIYRCGCPEFTNCGYWNMFVDKYGDYNLYDIETRYNLYNAHFYENRRIMND